MNENLVYRILICKDEDVHAKDMEETLAAFGKSVGVNIKCFYFGEMNKELQNMLNCLKLIDFAIVDMEAEDVGFRLAKVIQTLKPLLPIIFLTNDDSHYQEAGEMLAVGTLRKPVKKLEMRMLFYRALGQVNFLNQNYGKPYLEFVINKEKIRIPCRNICCLEKLQKKVIIRTYTKTYELRATLMEIEQKLPAYFLRISQSVIINVNEIREVEGKQITICDYGYFTIGRTYGKKVNSYFRWISGNTLA